MDGPGRKQPWAMAGESRPAYARRRGLKTPPAELWPRVKHWN
jgi:hypothetical protein